MQTTCTSSYHDENTSKVSKGLVQNCKRSCAHKTPRVNVDGWQMNGRTDEQMDRNLHTYVAHAKAGVTKIHQENNKSHPLLPGTFSFTCSSWFMDVYSQSFLGQLILLFGCFMHFCSFIFITTLLHTCDISLFWRELPIFCPFLRKSPYQNFRISFYILYISLFGISGLPTKIWAFPSLLNHSPYLKRKSICHFKCITCVLCWGLF